MNQWMQVSYSKMSSAMIEQIFEEDHESNGLSNRME